jgi:glycosyltransferase involved in cell wall biosynthesis
MRVLILHNRYREKGGEDSVALAEAALLRTHGIEVFEFEVGNAPTNSYADGALRLGIEASWSRRSYNKILEICRRYRPDVAHVHNFWMQLSPSVHAACHESGAATVQTLHNFRLLCTNALLLRNGWPCEDCLGKVPWRGLMHRCYRDSFLASAAVAKMIVSNRIRGTWERDVDAFIALSEFSRWKLIAGHLPAGRLFVKPNFIRDLGPAPSPPSASNVVLYAGRLSKEKGLHTLLSAWTRAELGTRGQLVIAGDGPERQALERQGAAQKLSSSNVIFTGWLDSGQVRTWLERARVLVLPSLWYEAFPMIILEAFCCGRPVVVSDIGSLGEIVQHEREGLKFDPGNEAVLGDTLKRVLTGDALADRLGANARAAYLTKYTPERNYEMLMRIYCRATERRRGIEVESLSGLEPVHNRRAGAPDEVSAECVPRT